MPARVLELQRQAGNHAVGALLARRRGGGEERKAKPVGVSLGELIVTQAPGLLPHLDGAWLKEKQSKWDADASNKAVTARAQDFADRYEATYKLPWRGDGNARARVEKIQEEYVRAPGDAGDAEIPTELLLEPSILAEPEFNKALELRFRTKIHAELKSKPIRVRVDPHYGVSLLWEGAPLRHTKGRIGWEDLMATTAIAKRYVAEVTDAPEIRQLREGISNVHSLIWDVSAQHQERSDKNAEHPIVRRVAESLGGPSVGDIAQAYVYALEHPEKGTPEQALEQLAAPYPSAKGWREPREHLALAGRALKEGQFEVALWAFASAEARAIDMAQRFHRYETKVTRGAGIAIKYLGYAKIAGTIAAGIATAGWSLPAQGAAAAGYAFTREGAQELSMVNEGLQESVNLVGLLKTAGVEGAMAMIGGATQGSFNRTLNAHLGTRLAGVLGSAERAQIAISSSSAFLSGFYTAPANAVLNRLAKGEPLPKSLDALAKMIVDEAFQGGFMDMGLGLALKGRGVHAKPDAPDAPSAKGIDPGRVPDPPAAGAAGQAIHSVAPPSAPGGPAAATPPKITDLAAKDLRASSRDADVLLDALGPWEQAMWHLRKGTGPAADLPAAQRKDIMDALADRRQKLAEQVRDKFGSDPAGEPSSEPESDIDLNVSGADAGMKAVQIRMHLDSTHPGWERRFRMGVMVEAARTGRLADAMKQLPPALRQEVARRQVLGAEAMHVMRQARAAPTPEARSAELDKIGDPTLRAEAERLATLDPAAARGERDRLLIESDRKLAALDENASPAERAKQIEEAQKAQMWANGLDAESYVSGGAIQSIVLDRKLQPAQAYEAVIDQVSMIQHQAADAGGMYSAMRRYETFKYIKRICDHMQAAGVKDPRIGFLRNHAELVYNVERQAVSSAHGRDISAGDLTKTAHARSVRHDDLGEVQGVGDAFLAEVHGMLKGVVEQHLPALRSHALGPAGAGAAGMPVKLPELGSPPAAGAASTGRVGSVQGGPAPTPEPPGTGLTDPAALERLAAAAINAPAVAPGTKLQAQADAAYLPLALELKRLGVTVPPLVVRDLGDPASWGHYDPISHTIVVNEGASMGTARAFDTSPEGSRRLFTVLLHEARHVEQRFQALRHACMTEPSDAVIAHATGVDISVVQRARARPLPPGTSREAHDARMFYEEFFGRQASMTRFGQDRPRQQQLEQWIDQANTAEAALQAQLMTIKWYELWKLLDKVTARSRLTKLQRDLMKVTTELTERRDTYRFLLHEVDARRAEQQYAEVLGREEIAASHRRVQDAQEGLRIVQRLAPHDEQLALAAVDQALAVYVATLKRVEDDVLRHGFPMPAVPTVP